MIYLFKKIEFRARERPVTESREKPKILKLKKKFHFLHQN
jgi:hypothetical protein